MLPRTCRMNGSAFLFCVAHTQGFPYAIFACSIDRLKADNFRLENHSFTSGKSSRFTEESFNLGLVRKLVDKSFRYRETNEQYIIPL